MYFYHQFKKKKKIVDVDVDDRSLTLSAFLHFYFLVCSVLVFIKWTKLKSWKSQTYCKDDVSIGMEKNNNKIK